MAGILGALCDENDPTFTQRVAAFFIAGVLGDSMVEKLCLVSRLHQRNVLGSISSESHFHRISWKQ